MGASAVRARAIDCAVVKAYYYGRERARTAERAQPARSFKLCCPADGFLDASPAARFEEYVGGSPDVLLRSLKKTNQKRGRLPSRRSHFAAPSFVVTATRSPPKASKMSDQASLLATIAGLQEQIDAMNGQLTEVRPASPSAAPVSRARRGRGGLPPPSRRPRPRGAAAGAAARPSPALAGRSVPALAGRRGRTRDHKSARALKTKMPPASRHDPRRSTASSSTRATSTPSGSSSAASSSSGCRRASPCSRSARSTRRTRRTSW